MPGRDFRKGGVEKAESGRSGIERERQIGIEQDQTKDDVASSNETLRGKRAGGTG